MRSILFAAIILISICIAVTVKGYLCELFETCGGQCKNNFECSYGMKCLNNKCCISSS